MQRLVGLPFAIVLAVVSFSLIAAGAAVLQEEASAEGDDGSSSLVDLDAFSRDESRPDQSGAIAGASLLGFGILGFIAAVALLIASMAGGRDVRPAGVGEPQQQQQQQQQQQVVVVRGDSVTTERDR